MSEHYLWTEKYRPQTLDEFICTQDIREMIQGWVDAGQCPHLIIFGPFGTGKTALAQLLIKALKSFPLEFNDSSSLQIDTVRKGIKRFATMGLASGLKIVFLDEFDNASDKVAKALRRSMERWAKRTRFIFTCNTTSAVDDGIRDRCMSVNLHEQPREELEKDIEKRAEEILKKERIKFSVNDIRKVMKEGYSEEYGCYSIRNIINNLQKYSKNGRLVVN
jgi:DNA polymerase III delta prime subunit